MLCMYIACNKYTWHGCTIQHLDDGVIHVHVVLLADGQKSAYSNGTASTETLE